MQKRIPIHVVLIILCIAGSVPLRAWSIDPFPTESFEQDFLITAYYSPKPHQCCYVLGGLEADRSYNGQGIHAADGTEVYAGMIAAPPRYPFGTKVFLPGLGTFIVHDRGGAIQEQKNGLHRLDIWIGEGEEGLARAFSFGEQQLRGTVYPPGGGDALTVSFSPEHIPLDMDRLERYYTAHAGLLAMRPRFGERGMSVQILQETLRDTGYFAGSLTGIFDDRTQESLQQFLTEYALTEPSDQLTEHIAAMLLAAREWAERRKDIPYVSSETESQDIARAQKLLRRLGYYHGRTDGTYDQDVFDAILVFQQKHALAGDRDSPGAGTIGPLTSRSLQTVIAKRWVEWYANKLLDRQKIVHLLQQRNALVDRFLEEGKSGDDVRALQTLLAQSGYFPQEEINGNFGPLTKEAVTEYQIAEGIIRTRSHPSAGFAGPSTIRSLHEKYIRSLYSKLRAEGWKAL
ncbi:hypothetical protein COU77_01170 [Candidatus Peregrinibacteria bacterium CG10_big_fil_rev_8_21_14_0_10_49_16]|nr:MAG: hypothetical protein COW95_00120 [Candidatus Peregrinibacteria bacterium CG22_combo_CG10-13_8_21_14_all_49_11]PIR52295.1 MAG: hypothetical protein COU77_01170 [Candidatus Peregrinibacteria bacterium CG10_big_fil_rev_8_21_14_0_10_49_16]